MGGKVYEAAQLEVIASLPTRDEAIAKLLYVMKAPVEKFVRTLAEPLQNLSGCWLQYVIKNLNRLRVIGVFLFNVRSEKWRYRKQKF